MVAEGRAVADKAHAAVQRGGAWDVYAGWPVPTPALTAIETAAAGMSVGEWLRITAADAPGGNSYFDDPVNATTNLYDYCHKAGYDPVNKRFLFYGMGHGGQMMRLALNFADTTWSKTGPPPWWSSGEIGHGYSHTAVDPTTGDEYARFYNDTGGVHRLASGSWTRTAVESAFPSGIPNAAHGAIEYLPGIGASGGLVAMFGDSIRRWDKSTNAWSLALQVTNRGNGAMACYSHSEGVAYMGAGVSSTQDWYRVPPSGTVTQLPNCPLATNNTEGCVAVCPVSGDVLVFSTDANAQRYNGTSWAAQSFTGAPTFTVTTGSGTIVAPIGPAGVIGVLLGNVGQFWLYKHAA